MTAADFPVANPASFAAEPITADEVLETDPGQVAHVINTYAKVLAAHELHLEVQAAALQVPQ